MAIVNPPPADSVDRQDSTGALVEPREGWRNFFQAIYVSCVSVSESGVTAKRPTKFLWVGRRFFDTTLGIPIWYNGAAWVNASGAVV